MGDEGSELMSIPSGRRRSERAIEDEKNAGESSARIEVRQDPLQSAAEFYTFFGVTVRSYVNLHELRKRANRPVEKRTQALEPSSDDCGATDSANGDSSNGVDSRVRRTTSSVPEEKPLAEAVNGDAVTTGLRRVMLEEAEDRRRSRHSAETVAEWVRSEEQYCRRLRLLAEDYLGGLAGRRLAPSAMRVLALGARRLLALHERLLPALLAAAAARDLARLAGLFLDNENAFEIYIEYSRNKNKSREAVEEYRELFKTRQARLGLALDAESYLLEPVQRLPRYALLLRALEDVAPPAAASALRAATAVVTRLLERSDAAVALDLVRSCAVDLHEQGELLYQREFTVVESGRRVRRGRRERVQSMVCFLFERLLLLTSPERGERGHGLRCRACLRVAELQLEVDGAGSVPCLRVTRRGARGGYRLEGPAADCAVWADAISALLQKVPPKDERVRHRYGVPTPGPGFTSYLPTHWREDAGFSCVTEVLFLQSH